MGKISPDQCRNLAMIRIYLRLAIPLIIIFIALNVAARALGSTQPPNPALRGFTEGCEHTSKPCWYGIVFGQETDLATVQSELEKLGGIGNCVRLLTENNGEILPELRCQKLEHLGDVMVQFGEIESVILDEKHFPHLPLLRFRNNIEVVILPNTSEKFSWSPYNYVMFLNFYDQSWGGEVNHSWQGFVPLWKYCQLETTFFYCHILKV